MPSNKRKCNRLMKRNMEAKTVTQVSLKNWQTTVFLKCLLILSNATKKRLSLLKLRNNSILIKKMLKQKLTQILKSKKEITKSQR